MPYQRRGSYSRRRGSRLGSIVNSTKNIVYNEDSIGTAITTVIFANAVDSAALASTPDVERSCQIKNVWISLDFCGLAASGVQQTTRVYLIKNEGANLTPPTPGTEGSSNEKKFIFKEWEQMTMRNQDGNPPYHWEGWVKIPKRYQRMGANDNLSMSYACTNAAGHLSSQIIYKWYK